MTDLETVINSLPNNIRVEGYGSANYKEYYLKRDFGEYMVWVGYDGKIYELGTYRKWGQDHDEEMANVREFKTMKAVINYLKRFL